MSHWSCLFAHRSRPIAFTAILALLLSPVLASATPCVVPDAGGTVVLPPNGCGYVSPTDLHLIIDGLPPGTTIQVGVEHQRFFPITTTPDPAGGDIEDFGSQLTLHLQGTGSLASFARTLVMQAQCQSHTDAHSPGTAVQSFDTEMRMIQGQLPIGDPDFDLLRITAGSSFGMPSPGHTTLTQLSGGNWNIDSFFDITYRIDFAGHPGGPLGGMSGSTTGTIRMGTGQPMPTQAGCVVANTGGGTVNLPPPGCGYVSPNDLHMMIDGLPPGTQIVVAASHDKFLNITHTPGGPLGGEVEHFTSNLTLQMKGNGSLSTFARTILVPTQCESHTGPRTPGAVVQSFDTDMFGIQGQITGDPDFDLLRVTAGTGFGLPSPGHTTLTLGSDNNWNIDSFFDITYRIDFIGHPGGPLGGMSGSTTGTIRMGTGEPAPAPPGPCTVVQNPDGTVSLPPAGCGYVSPADLHMMIDGLPPGTEVHIAAQHMDFFNVTHVPDGTVGGETEQFQSGLQLHLQGTGELAGYDRFLTMQTQCQSHIGPHQSGTNIQSFDTEMMRIQGQLQSTGDPDFDLLRITAGSAFGMPSPGHTTLTRQGPPGGPYNVDSFFDITYRIDFVGHPGGPFTGHSGSTTGTIRMQAGQPTLLSVPGGERPSARSVELLNSPNPFSPGTTIQYRLPSAADVRVMVYDAAGHAVRELTDARLPAGPHAVLWDGRDKNGHKLDSGTYFIRLSVDGTTIASKKAVLLK